MADDLRLMLMLSGCGSSTPVLGVLKLLSSSTTTDALLRYQWDNISKMTLWLLLLLLLMMLRLLLLRPNLMLLPLFVASVQWGKRTVLRELVWLYLLSLLLLLLLLLHAAIAGGEDVLKTATVRSVVESWIAREQWLLLDMLLMMRMRLRCCHCRL